MNYLLWGNTGSLWWKKKTIHNIFKRIVWHTEKNRSYQRSLHWILQILSKILNTYSKWHHCFHRNILCLHPTVCREKDWYKIVSQTKRIPSSLWLEGKYRSSHRDKHLNMGSFIFKKKKENVILTRLDGCNNPSSSFGIENTIFLFYWWKTYLFFLFSNLLFSALLLLLLKIKYF